jgi:hypothetical protein
VQFLGTSSQLTQWRDRAGFSPNFQVLREPQHSIAKRPKRGTEPRICVTSGAYQARESRSSPFVMRIQVSNVGRVPA